MKISEEAMEKRIAFAREFFEKNKEATVGDLNRELAKTGQQKMGAKAYEVHEEVKRMRRKGSIPAAAAHAPKEPVTDEVSRLLSSLATRLKGTNISKILLDVSGETPSIRYTETETRERTVPLKQ